jgi:hypothetical protein
MTVKATTHAVYAQAGANGPPLTTRADLHKVWIEEAYKWFPDEVHHYTPAEVEELARLGIKAHPEGKIVRDRSPERFAFLTGAGYGADTVLLAKKETV